MDRATSRPVYSVKRDFDLIRRILIDVEKMSPGDILDRCEYPEYDHGMISEHVRLLLDADFVQGRLTESYGGGSSYSVSGLTLKGHDFLDAAKDKTIWERAKEAVLKSAKTIPLDVFLQWLKEFVKQQLGLP